MSIKKSSLTWSQYLKDAELEIIFPYISSKKTAKILEIGGGDGYQAYNLSKKGFNVTSIDVSPKSPQYYDVKKNDSSTLNFPDGYFDIVYSSSVLPHIEQLTITFDEIKRVLNNNGIIIHILPSSWWTIQTNFWHYFFIPKYLFRSIRKRFFRFNSEKKDVNKIKTNFKDLNTSNSNIKKLFLHPLGLNPSFIHEIYYFSKFYWSNLFLQHDFKIVKILHGPYVTSGYGVFNMKFMKSRKFLNTFFPSLYCFILKK